MRALVNAMLVVPLIVLIGCGGRGGGTEFRAPYVASVPAGWEQLSCADENAVWLEQNDVMWVPSPAPGCGLRRVPHANGTVSFESTDIPAEALIFCSARRIKDAPSTYCDTARILHWRNPRHLADKSLTLCRGLSARYAMLEDRVGATDAVAETVTASLGGISYFGLYMRVASRPRDPRAKASIASMCPFHLLTARGG